jgi:hypothetical protein
MIVASVDREDCMTRVYIPTLPIIVLACLSASATIIDIPDDYPTIQQGIDASIDGDTVLVQPGTYVENINFNGHNIVLGSMFLITGEALYISSTFIDGSFSGSVVTVNSGESDPASITGFTLRNGSYIRGAGIYCDGSDLTIANNIIRDNFAYADENWNGVGGGIYCHQANPTITCNMIRNNRAFYYGGGICCFESDATISFNLIVGDTALYGGGICCGQSSPEIISNTIYHNMAEMGGGIYTMFTSYPTITNTIFWADSSTFGDNEIGGDDASFPWITYCDIQDIEWPGEGNISCDPDFCNPMAGDFHLNDGSCCLGSGQDGADIGALGAGCNPSIPTLSEWGMLIMGLLILTVGTIAVVRRRKTAISKAT